MSLQRREDHMPEAMANLQTGLIGRVIGVHLNEASPRASEQGGDPTQSSVAETGTMCHILEEQ